MTSYTHTYLDIPDEYLDIIDLAILSHPNLLLEIQGINGKRLYFINDELSINDAMEAYTSLTSLLNS